LVPSKEPIGGEDADYWVRQGEKELEEALNLTPNTKVAKNIILFIGDGMSLPTVTAARTYKGQLDKSTGADGSSAQLFWESFPYRGLSKTYCANYMVPDSAATASAMYTGQKTTFFTMGYDSSVEISKPESVGPDAEQTTMLDWAQAAGKRTGFVTTTRMSHATPAALYAKTVNRFWEGDNNILESIKKGAVTEDQIKDNNVKDISRQLIESEAGQKIDIMLGGGRASFQPESYKEIELDATMRGEAGFDYDDERDIWDNYRRDNRSLIDEWLLLGPGRRYITNKTDLAAIDSEATDQVMGIFTNSYVTWDDMLEQKPTVPSIAEMAVASVKFLKEKSGPEGFFVMIEGGRIDAAHHNGNAVRALSETVAFDKAIEEVMALVDPEETLVIVTADHAHTMSMGGYTHRELDITGSNPGDLGKDVSILSYGNGPGFKNLVTTGEGDYTQIDVANVTQEVNGHAEIRFKQPSAAPMNSETHGGDDVGIWAQGPWAHLIHGTHQQSYLATVMAYAGCVSKYSTREGCPAPNRSSGSTTTTETEKGW